MAMDFIRIRGARTHNLKNLDLDIRIILGDAADDDPNVTTDNFLDDIVAGARVATSNALDSKTFTSATFDAADEVVLVPGDAPDLPGLVLAKQLKVLHRADVASVPELNK